MGKGERDACAVAVDRSECFGERLLGALLDRAHQMPPQMIAPLVAEQAGKLGGRDVCILLQDYGQRMLQPLPGIGLLAAKPERLGDSPAGRAFLHMTVVEEQEADGVRIYLPLLDGSDVIGVFALTLDNVDDDDRRLLRRFARLVAVMLVAKNGYTDQLCQARRSAPMSLSAEIQWALLPPMTMVTPQVALAGILEPAYDVAGDSFDYAINDNIVHMAVIDAMGHGLNAAMLATLAIGAYRQARRANVGLVDLYGLMDTAIDTQFGPDQFVTAQMMCLDLAAGQLEWVNAGHPSPLLIRDGQVIQALEGPGTLPVGFGGATPVISEQELRPGDRVLFFTDGAIEEHRPGGEQFGVERLTEFVERAGHLADGVQQMVRTLSHILVQARGGVTTDDTTLFLVEWRQGAGSGLTAVESFRGGARAV
jgi:serine phosphatase RsbU (regulator of sigma subunit)